MNQFHFQFVVGQDVLPAELGALKRLQAETGAQLDALLPALLDRVFTGEL